MLRCDFRKLVAVGLLSTTTLITMPVTAADFSSPSPVIGSVSAVGAVDLRGVEVSQEGTLFSGDSIRSHEKGYAKVLLGTGSKIELYGQTQVTVNRDAQGVKIAMDTGNLGFNAKSPLRVDITPFEVTASDDAAGNVAVMSSTTAGVRAIKGKVTVRNLKTSESFVLMKGQEQLLGLPKGSHTAPLGQVASNVPMVPPVPTVPQTPAGKTTNPGLAMDTGSWLALIGGGALAGLAIWAVVEAHNNRDDINSQGAQIKALSQAQAIQANLAQQQATLAQVSANAQAALNALFAAGQQNTSQAQALQAVINAAAAQQANIASLLSQAGTCAAGIGSCNISSLLSLTQTQVGNTNNVISQGNAANNAAHLLNANAPAGNVQPVGNPPVASASVPA